MAVNELSDVRLISGMRLLQCPLRRCCGASVRRNSIREKHPAGECAFASRPCRYELNYREKSFFRRLKKSAMNSDFARRKAYDDSSILRQPDFVVPVESKSDKNPSKIVTRSRRRLELQRKLELKSANPDQPAERSKQR